ncbi:alpha/beta fold hydrolase [Streptomyces sp. H10-C2]|uniref:alpha/beta fold hydrolase n=1 Tax=unclassified Streptomyces TaxID=2593676 RepID=UPI0024BB7FB4|nr:MULTISPECIES: alpha/beta fold hydrolase [unclassified Streptomyces]MDJ0345773.1 alpha/beta fold hydrolase [Streptomyces sp. PH10-H1]MDJ0374663.1 alpha/beta fold hydrolase [Streptomyces sp. H10-C2]
MTAIPESPRPSTPASAGGTNRCPNGRGRTTAPYAVAREVEDLHALIAQTGGQAYLYGISSGAALALAAAAASPGITKLALYEPPFMAESEDGTGIKKYTEQLHELLDAGRRGDAVALFMTHVGIPAQAVAHIRTQPGWAALEAIAPTLEYDDEVLGDGSVPRDLASMIAVPALVLAGGAGPWGLQQAARATADALPTAGHRTLNVQTQDVAPEALAPVLAEFFGA